MYGGAPEWGSFAPSGQTIAVRMTDTGTDLLVALGKFSGTDPEDGRTYEDEDDLSLVDSGAEPIATITGSAADLDTWLWKRDPTLSPGWHEGDRIRIEGDRLAYEKLSAIVGQPLN
jgi:hypothetical protein